jgi:hypothetical protein
MQEALERVMQTYSMMVSLTPEAEAEARKRVQQHLVGIEGDDNVLAVAGLRFLRGSSGGRRRSRA